MGARVVIVGKLFLSRMSQEQKVSLSAFVHLTLLVQHGEKTERAKLNRNRALFFLAATISTTKHPRHLLDSARRLQVIIMIGKQTLLLGLALLASVFLADGAKLRRIQSGKQYTEHENVKVVVNKVG